MTLRNIIVFLLFWLGAVGPLRGAEKYIPLPPSLDGSMMPFDFSTCTQPTYLPDSLVPVYASYVARHGSRYLSGPSKLKPVIDALQEGRNKGTLSNTGEAFFVLMEKIERANEGNWGDLSPIGYNEERRLAKRVYDILTPLKNGGERVNAISSYMPRCVMTMYLLTHGLVRENDSLRVMTDEGHQFDGLVCCFMADETFAKFRKDGKWKSVYDEFVRQNVSTEPARRLFTRTNLSDQKLRKLTLDMYEVLKANRAAGLPAPTTQWMSVQEYEGCWRASNLQHYLRNTITPVSNLAGKATAPLLREIMSKIDRAVSVWNPQPVFDGYFGHAETLLPLLSLMKLPGCYDMSTDYNALDKKWRVQNITPLGANMIILVSRGPSGRHYVSIRLNGRSVRAMPGKPDFVAWEDLKAYWENCLRNL